MIEGIANGTLRPLQLAAFYLKPHLRSNGRGFPPGEMARELKLLALSIVLGLAQIVLASHAASLQRGYVWTASSRDEAMPTLTGLPGRLARALQNFVETFPLFAAGVLIAHVAATHSWMTECVVPSVPYWRRRGGRGQGGKGEIACS